MDVKQPTTAVLLCCVTSACAVQIIHVNLTSTEPVALKEGEEVAFTFAVNWLPTVTPFKSRFERYLDYNFFEHKVQRAIRTNFSCSNVYNQFTQQLLPARRTAQLGTFSVVLQSFFKPPQLQGRP